MTLETEGSDLNKSCKSEKLQILEELTGVGTPDGNAALAGTHDLLQQADKPSLRKMFERSSNLGSSAISL